MKPSLENGQTHTNGHAVGADGGVVQGVHRENGSNAQGPKGAFSSPAQRERVINGGMEMASTKKILGQDWVMASDEAQREAAPLQQFQKAKFEELMNQYEGVSGTVKSTVELGQALLMTTNMKEAAANVQNMQVAGSAKNSVSNSGTHGKQGSTKSTSKGTAGGSNGEKVNSTPEYKSTGGAYFFKQDYMADLSKKCASKDFEQVSKLLSNLGPQDKSSNWLLEQRNFDRSQAPQEREISQLIDNKIVDSLEYVRAKENIAQAKQRGDELMKDMSDSENEDNGDLNDHTTGQDGISPAQLDTEEDSGQAQRSAHEMKINGIIKQIRQNAQSILGPRDGRDYTMVPLSQVCKKLRKEETFIKRRDQKELNKGNVSDQISTLKNELSKLQEQEARDNNVDAIKVKINSLEQVLGLEKRMKTDQAISTIAELDMQPMTPDAFDIQNVLFDFCGVNLTGQEDAYGDSFSHQTRFERLFSKIRKMPKKSCLLQNFDEKFFDPNEESNQDRVVKQHQELVKVVGLEPDKLFEKVPKYRIQVDKIPKFSNTFDSIDSVISGLNNRNSIPGQQIINNISSSMNFNRIDGRQVISLQFNPFFMNEDPEKKKIYDGYMREIIEQRDKIRNAPKEAKIKQETANIKRAWANIVKKDIPKAYRLYQKFKADQETNNKKLSQNCLKEVRKRAVRTQRLAKESVMRARKLTKDMCHYWRKRDKEMADSKRKREKLDKELKKRQQEEEEALQQKKRLEYLMQQSEIYAHFMATKLGVSEDLKNSKKDHGMNDENAPRGRRVEVDLRAARSNVANIINENRKRLDDFDDHDRDEIGEEELEVNFNEKPMLNDKVQKPDMFLGDLKAYQLKGLQWLDNLYDQGINGILADEMGLGKTIQTIALLSHLAEKKNVWGPFLIVVPVTTLHNWQNELTKFCPTLKVLPYFGSAEERKKLAKFLDPKNLYNPAMCIHVLITSYNLIAGGGKDQMRLQRVKWHYMILDEAQAIKNNASRRWKTLLNFQTRNRLLLSGTPIQNSMAELWALLHFIMPTLFDNHEQFQEWFSKDIEQHSMDQGELNKHQLKRLHLILQPFMLRRLKKDVEQEIAPKVEETIYCDMTHRQRTLYNRIKMKISAADLFQLASSKAKMENLMNLVMQFRKVCNHPDLFERRMGKIPFTFCKMQTGMLQNMSLVTKPDIFIANTNPISFELPQLIYDECFMISDNNTRLFTKQAKGIDQSMITVSVETHFKLFNIFNSLNLHESIYGQTSNVCNFKSGFSIIGLLMSSNSWSIGDISYMASTDKMVQTISLLHYYSQRYKTKNYLNINQNEDNDLNMPFGSFGMVFNNKKSLKTVRPDIIVSNFVNRDESLTVYRSHVVENLSLDIEGNWIHLLPMIPNHPKEFLGYSRKTNALLNIFYEKAITEPMHLSCRSSSFNRMYNSIRNNPVGKKALIGSDFKPKKDSLIGKVGSDRSSFLTQDLAKPANCHYQLPPSGYPLLDKGILQDNFDVKGSSIFQLPDYSRLVTDCSKMNILAGLLRRLSTGGHRCLIFCQMTKMMDLLEDFFIWQKYSYFRMDGQTQLQDRRFMVEEFQSNPNVFIFMLSTRAGGLGINLIAADTVIFYDNDWNPTMDSQATDRAHRIGQKKKVHVYRLVTKNSVEERILRRAKQKESVQSTVYGANLKADSFSSRDVVDMIIDDIDEDPLANLGSKNQVKGFIKTGNVGLKKERVKRKKKGLEGSNEPAYISIKRSKHHDKFENEADMLMADIETVKEDVADSGEDDGQSEGSDEEMNNSSYPQSATDRKKFLLQMLDRQTGGAKQTFNFEEDDAPQNKIGDDTSEPAKKKRGRPAKDKMQLDDDDDIEEDEPEY